MYIDRNSATAFWTPEVSFIEMRANWQFAEAFRFSLHKPARRWSQSHQRLGEPGAGFSTVSEQNLEAVP
jgi:hypothetical protein